MSQIKEYKGKSGFDIIDTVHFDIQRKIVANMTTESWVNIPHSAAMYEADITDFLSFFKSNLKDKGITINTLLLKVMVEGIKACPKMNGHIEFSKRLVRGKIETYKDINISMPMIMPDGAMMTINMHNFENRTLNDMQDYILDVKRRMEKTDLTEAMFSVSMDNTLTALKKGKLIIISPANSNGAKNSTRYVKDRLDLNRSFPGDKNGNAAEVIADEIYNRVKESGACLLLDLHEARIVNSKADFLGSSVIYTELDKMDDLFFDLIFAAQTGEICSEPFNYHFPAPEGSINHEVTCGLGIPSITIETFRGYQLERRISDQLDIVQYVLRYFGML